MYEDLISFHKSRCKRYLNDGMCRYQSCAIRGGWAAHHIEHNDLRTVPTCEAHETVLALEKLQQDLGVATTTITMLREELTERKRIKALLENPSEEMVEAGRAAIAAASRSKGCGNPCPTPFECSCQGDAFLAIRALAATL